MRSVLTDVLVVLGLAIVTIGVYGVIRLPDVYTQLHASGKAAFLGIVLLLVAAGLQGDGPILTRWCSSPCCWPRRHRRRARRRPGRARRGEEMRTPGAVDETAHDRRMES
jgi:multicomponent Na+:H+ antiporter subunit G